mmetsp:Transcript_40306/g.94407  ORF Transcript_40306/g.94407 Transcript_40306/m.94407 type:complete len:339 (+) Transcript_40306:163-1179(+)
MSVGSDCSVICGLIKLGDIEALKRFTPVCFDWSLCDSPYKTPVLHAAILDGVTRPELHDNILEILSWLLKMGADPQQKAPSNANRFDIWKTHRPETTTVTLKCAGHTALSLALALREALMGSGVEFPDECTFLEAVVSVISMPARKAPRVAINPGVLDRWEKVLEMTETHNVTFETADGEVTAHDILLMASSPVLRVMLESSMVEGKQKRIKVKDAASGGVSLFVEMLYTNATRRGPDYKTVLTALDLAHRWQVENVVQILADALRDMITFDSFVLIAEAATLKGLEMLKTACAAYGAADSKLQCLLKNGRLPPAVSRLLGQADSPNEEQSSKKRRVF